MKRVIVISTSLRRGSNSDMLADKFVEGAKAAGNERPKRMQQNAFYARAVRKFVLFLLFCSCCTNAPKSEITAEMAYEGVSNYCHSVYDWSIAKENPSIMHVHIGEETDSAYQVVFHSYTGTLVNFYVDKTSGTTRIEEYVPTLDLRNEAGTIDIFEYIDKKK
jgi:hypothetical protein